jgi:hypothetical protein
MGKRKGADKHVRPRLRCGDPNAAHPRLCAVQCFSVHRDAPVHAGQHGAGLTCVATVCVSPQMRTPQGHATAKKARTPCGENVDPNVDPAQQRRAHKSPGARPAKALLAPSQAGNTSAARRAAARLRCTTALCFESWPAWRGLPAPWRWDAVSRGFPCTHAGHQTLPTWAHSSHRRLARPALCCQPAGARRRPRLVCSRQNCAWLGVCCACHRMSHLLARCILLPPGHLTSAVMPLQRAGRARCGAADHLRPAGRRPRAARAAGAAAGPTGNAGVRRFFIPLLAGGTADWRSAGAVARHACAQPLRRLAAGAAAARQSVTTNHTAGTRTCCRPGRVAARLHCAADHTRARAAGLEP